MKLNEIGGNEGARHSAKRRGRGIRVHVQRLPRVIEVGRDR